VRSLNPQVKPQQWRACADKNGQEDAHFEAGGQSPASPKAPGRMLWFRIMQCAPGRPIMPGGPVPPRCPKSAGMLPRRSPGPKPPRGPGGPAPIAACIPDDTILKSSYIVASGLREWGLVHARPQANRKHFVRTGAAAPQQSLLVVFMGRVRQERDMTKVRRFGMPEAGGRLGYGAAM